MLLKRQVSNYELVIVALLLCVTATFFPLPLYLFALACFGLPHVIWEISWVKQLYGQHISPIFWRFASVILVLQAIARLGDWLKWLDSRLVQAVDVLTLALLLVLAACALFTRKQSLCHGWLAGGVLLIALALLYATQQHNLLIILVCLSITHNFTPVLLAHISPQPVWGEVKHALLWLFGLPVLLFVLLIVYPLSGLQTNPLESYAFIPEVALLTQPAPNLAHATLSALVLAQCLHYYAVIRIIPASLGQSFKVIFGLKITLIVCGVLTLYFASQFGTAKGLYAIAAGAHAWLEWFVIAILAGSVLAVKNTRGG